MSGEWSRGSFTYDAVGLGHTQQNIINGFTSFLTQNGWAVPSWATNTLDRYYTRTDSGTSDVWRFNGDGPTQKCGIRITSQVSPARIFIRTFLENTAGTADQRSSNTGQQITITVDATAPNNYLLIGGEEGLFVECGRDGLPTNLGHGFVGTVMPQAEWYSTKDANRMWLTQGFAFDLFGSLTSTNSRTSYPMITNDGTNRVFTAGLFARFVRGAANAVTNTQADDRTQGLSHRDLAYGVSGADNAGARSISNHCLGGMDTVVDNRYIVSPMIVRAGPENYFGSSSNDSGINTVVSSNMVWRNPRYDYRVRRFSSVSYTIVPFANITDVVTSIVHRVSRVADAGRTFNVGIEWPATVTTITL